MYMRYNFENVLDDFIFLCIFVGNDFLPHLPTLEIREGAISTLSRLYRRLLPNLPQYLTTNGALNVPSVMMLLKDLSREEDSILRRRREREERARSNRRARRESDRDRDGPRPSDRESALAATERRLRNIQASQIPKEELIPFGSASPTPSLAPEANRSAAAALKAAMQNAAEKPPIPQTDGPNDEEPNPSMYTMPQLRTFAKTLGIPTTNRSTKIELWKAIIAAGGPPEDSVPAKGKARKLSAIDASDSPSTKKQRGDEPEKPEKATAPAEDHLELVSVGEDDALKAGEAPAEPAAEEPQAPVVPATETPGVAPSAEQPEDAQEAAADYMQIDQDEKPGDELNQSIDKAKDEDPRRSKGDSEDDEPEDLVRLGEDGWRERYYSMKFKIDLEDLSFFKKITHAYLEGMAWVMKYYLQGCTITDFLGCQSWSWYYPFHYAPFAGDIQDYARDWKEKFQLGQPFQPFQQLMSVLPAASSNFLPEAYAKLMTNPDSPIADFYPPEFVLDLNGKRFAWQGVALLPFIDENRLLQALSGLEETLDEEEIRRNGVGSTYLLLNSKSEGATKLRELYETNAESVNFDTEPRPFNIFGSAKQTEANSLNKPLECPVPGHPPVDPNLAVAVSFHLPATPSEFDSTLLREAKLPEPVLTPEDLDRFLGSSYSRPGRYIESGGYRQIRHYSDRDRDNRDNDRDRDYRRSGGRDRPDDRRDRLYQPYSRPPANVFRPPVAPNLAGGKATYQPVGLRPPPVPTRPGMPLNLPLVPNPLLSSPALGRVQPGKTPLVPGSVTGGYGYQPPPKVPAAWSNPAAARPVANAYVGYPPAAPANPAPAPYRAPAPAPAPAYKAPVAPYQPPVSAAQTPAQTYHQPQSQPQPQQYRQAYQGYEAPAKPAPPAYPRQTPAAPASYQPPASQAYSGGYDPQYRQQGYDRPAATQQPASYDARPGGYGQTGYQQPQQAPAHQYSAPAQSPPAQQDYNRPQSSGYGQGYQASQQNYQPSSQGQQTQYHAQSGPPAQQSSSYGQTQQSQYYQPKTQYQQQQQSGYQQSGGYQAHSGQYQQQPAAASQYQQSHTASQYQESAASQYQQPAASQYQQPAASQYQGQRQYQQPQYQQGQAQGQRYPAYDVTPSGRPVPDWLTKGTAQPGWTPLIPKPQ